MKGGYALVDGKGIDIGSVSSGSAAGLNARLSAVVNGGKMVQLLGVVNGSATVSPVPAILEPGSSGSVKVEIGSVLVTVTSADKITYSSLVPPASSGYSATTDDLFTSAYLAALPASATVHVIPAAHTQGRTFSLNLGTKVVFMDFSGYSGTVSVTCTGFTSQGSKKYKVTGAISPWIQSETLTAITINED